jgi:hypothetical protein
MYIPGYNKNFKFKYIYVSILGLVIILSDQHRHN